ncbi:CRISPR-associated endoribonuclease Cas6 [Hathewaya histolytica]|uniref:CRISPR-associated endoribonuclease Cas6 n=1 Tax=Hathewaya histolytica TaxID=1498 RepID=UPI003B670F7E
MRIKINFRSRGKVVLPIQYNHIIQACLLKWLNEENYQKFIHNTGYKYENRQFKMYSFSKVMGNFKFNREDKTLIFDKKFSLVVTSEEDKFLSYIANNIILSDSINIKGQEIMIESVNILKCNIEEDMEIYTLSPITVYSTFQHNEKKKTYYYSPFESEFSELIRENLIKKYKAFYGTLPKNSEFSIEGINRVKQSVLNYKGITIKGWNGEFKIKGSKELINLAFNSGIGSKNSQGFGCIERRE